MVAPLKGIVEESYVGCLDFDCDINCIHDSTDNTWIIFQLIPDSKVKLKDKNVHVTRGRYLPKSKHTVWPADPLSHVLLLSLKLEYYGEKKGTVPLFLSLSRDPPQ